MPQMHQWVECRSSKDACARTCAQVHLRHLVGGRARSYMGELPHERIFQVCMHNPPPLLFICRASQPVASWEATRLC
jgi:hypothetical protein